MLRSLLGMQKGVADSLYASQNLTQKITPTTGQAIAYLNSSVDQMIYIVPAMPLASLTLSLPFEASSRIGQRVTFCTSQNILALTINGATTIMNPVTSLTSSDCFTFQKIDTNIWVHA